MFVRLKVEVKILQMHITLLKLLLICQLFIQHLHSFLNMIVKVGIRELFTLFLESNIYISLTIGRDSQIIYLKIGNFNKQKM